MKEKNGSGTGIGETVLHRATLEQGWTTAGTLGYGFTLMLRMADRVSPEAGVDYERELIALCYAFPDREARIRAFRERQPHDAER